MKKFFIALIGGTVFLIGVVMLVLPGPGILVILAALGILATEFLWAKRALQKAKNTFSEAQRGGGWRSWFRRKKPDSHFPPPVTAAKSGATLPPPPQ